MATELGEEIEKAMRAKKKLKKRKKREVKQVLDRRDYTQQNSIESRSSMIHHTDLLKFSTLNIEQKENPLKKQNKLAGPFARQVFAQTDI